MFNSGKTGAVPIDSAVSSFPVKSKSAPLSRKKFRNDIVDYDEDSDSGPVPPTPPHAVKSPRNPVAYYTNKSLGSGIDTSHDRSRQDLLSGQKQPTRASHQGLPPLPTKTKVTDLIEDDGRYRSSKEAKVSPLVGLNENVYGTNKPVDRTKMESVTSANRTEITNFGD